MSRTAASPAAAPSPAAHEWTFLTNHAHVLICLATDPDARLRDVADRVGITERAVQRIVQDLEEGGVITRSREGRRNRYRIHTRKALRHSVESHRRVADLLAMVADPDA
ncbi:MAG: helix-turn-helix transcriptional regulator [Phycisphaerales bacterium]